jgi:hypothetical protein
MIVGRFIEAPQDPSRIEGRVPLVSSDSTIGQAALERPTRVLGAAPRDFPEAELIASEVTEEGQMPAKRANVKNERQYEALKKKGMSKSRAAKIANSPGASKRGGKKSGSSSTRSTARQGGTTQQKKRAGRKGGKAAARKR